MAGARASTLGGAGAVGCCQAWPAVQTAGISPVLAVFPARAYDAKEERAGRSPPAPAAGMSGSSSAKLVMLETGDGVD